MESVAFTILIACITLAIGCRLGWTICNVRWADAANTGDAVKVRRETYYVIRWRDNPNAGPTNPPEILSAE